MALPVVLRWYTGNQMRFGSRRPCERFPICAVCMVQALRMDKLPGSSPGHGVGGFTKDDLRSTNLWVRCFINTNQYTIMENENKKMMVKLSELREWLDAGQVEFDVPGLVLTVDLDQTLAVVDVDAIEQNDRRRTKLRLLSAGLAHLAGEVLQGNPKAVGVVAEWAERRYAEERKKGLSESLAAALGEDEQEEE